ncbi:hypothetical protein [Gloeobacter kilaueensis]|uniref:Uncharacterized protein n=1 Tax=Gloeobacter kilaueensis (strain ATCC BAA-2537 / CCAP 1431/1 / ULC 316 / JS1) TaxID=1183438 RepID=U5QKD7_GLOK1|nr:hypothetical protein [Gloeobacter kilaueensis]AGY59318.1 hypothetical protein GKIL_3072 [Gloeobacter kilaueensis JS1]
MRFVDKHQSELKTLKAIYHLALEDPEHATYLKDVQVASGLGLKDLQDACKALQKSGYIERTNFRIVLNDEGVAHCEKLIEQERL